MSVMRSAVLLVSLAVLVAAGSRRRVPTDLWVVPFNSSHAAEMVLAQSLQGITGRDGPRLWLDRPNSMSEVILAELDQEGVRIHRVSSVWDLPDELWASASGYVRYELGTPSLNASISLAGLWDAVAADGSIADQVEARGLTMIDDATGLDDQQIFEQYGDLFARGIAIDQALTKPGYLRDFAVMQRAFTFWAGADREFRRRVAATLGPGATIYGWGPNEFQWIADFSASGGGGVAADFCVNLSAMCRLPVEIPPRPARPPPDPAQDGERIVAFVLSDGDNIQWQTGGMPLNQKWFASPVRGQFNMNWEVSPLLASVAPRVLRYFYDSATESDSFVAAGTPSYRYIHLEPDPRGVVDAQQVAPYLRKGRLKIVSVINDNQGSLEETIPLLERPEVDGVIYKRYSPYEGLHGQILWHVGKPAVSYKFVLWENHAGGSIQEVASAIAAMPALPRTDPGSYALVNVHAWSWAGIGGPIEAVKETIDRLPPNTRVVLIEDFFSLLEENVGPMTLHGAQRRSAQLPRAHGFLNVQP
jgi:hypothetical protein